MADKKIYCGQGKEVHPVGWEAPILKMEIDLTQIKEEGMAFTRRVEFRDGKVHTLIRCIAQPLREPKDFKTHAISIDTFDYEGYRKQKEAEKQAAGQQPEYAPGEPTDDLPF